MQSIHAWTFGARQQSAKFCITHRTISVCITDCVCKRGGPRVTFSASTALEEVSIIAVGKWAYNAIALQQRPGAESSFTEDRLRFTGRGGASAPRGQRASLQFSPVVATCHVAPSDVDLRPVARDAPVVLAETETRVGALVSVAFVDSKFRSCCAGLAARDLG